MKKRLLYLFAASFILSLLFSMVIVQAETGFISETRKSTLVTQLSQIQMESGAFHYFRDISGFPYYDQGSTGFALTIMSLLGSLDEVNVDRALAYIVTQQMKSGGGFGAFYDYYGQLISYDMGQTYYIVDCLKNLNALKMINTTAATDFMIARYNQSTGAFNEFLTKSAHGGAYAMASFSLTFHAAIGPMAYAVPNVISTYLGVSTLADLGMLSIINSTKTVAWLLSCVADNGGFKPFPNACPTFLPGWSSLISNPFDVDSAGAGLPYTFAVVEALKNLGKLDNLGSHARTQAAEYLLSCQDPYENLGTYSIFPGSDDSQIAYTYYAITALNDLTKSQTSNSVAASDRGDLLSQFMNATSKVTERLLNKVQQLQLSNSWPVPQPALSYYGCFFDTGTDPLVDTSYALMILNSTNNLNLLDQPTARPLKTSLNLVVLSLLIGSAVISIYTVSTLFKSKKKSLDMPEPDLAV
jgi:prenyltransferase beta subunit